MKPPKNGCEQRPTRYSDVFGDPVVATAILDRLLHHSHMLTVKPYINSNKNEVIDAAAIAEAVTRPTMRFVEIKTETQADLQALHRIRDRMVTGRTRLICQMRALCIEFGVAIHQGVGQFKADMPRVLASEENDLTPMMRRLLGDRLGAWIDTLQKRMHINKVTVALAAKVRARRMGDSQSAGSNLRTPCPHGGIEFRLRGSRKR